MSNTSCCFFFNDTATTEIYTLSLHDALPIFDYLADTEMAVILRIIQQSGGFIVENQGAGAGYRGCGLVEVDVHPLAVFLVLYLSSHHIFLCFNIQTAG